MKLSATWGQEIPDHEMSASPWFMRFSTLPTTSAMRMALVTMGRVSAVLRTSFIAALAGVGGVSGSF
jgi:hypothetical protein